MNKFLDEETFYEELGKRDEESLKMSVVNAMLFDPSFLEADEKIEILREKFPEIFEEKKKIADDDVELDQSEWTRDYFESLVWNFRWNFAFERIVLIKRVGKWIYKNKENFQEKSKKIEVTDKCKKKHHHTEGKIPKNRLIKKSMIGVVFVLILLIIAFLIWKWKTE